jgi:hypothetical protein
MPIADPHVVVELLGRKTHILDPSREISRDMSTSAP